MNIPTKDRKRHKLDIPAEGDDGLFTQSWFPICRSEDVPAGTVKGFGFLDGRIVVYRGEDGAAHVMSAYCPHLGADLAVGAVVGNDIQCAFHEWTFDGNGMCSGVKTIDVAPKKACLFNFPMREKYGVIWAFNGTEATWEIPDFPVPEEDLEFRVEFDNPPYPVDPWVICANTPDWQHLMITHRIRFDHEELYKKIKWTDNSMEYHLTDAEMDEGPVDIIMRIYGTSIFLTNGNFGGVDTYTMTGFGIPKPGYTQSFFILGVPKGDGTEKSRLKNKEALEDGYKLGLRITGDDRPILHTIRYTPGHLMNVDKALGKYLEIVRKYPRAHPSADFIR